MSKVYDYIFRKTRTIIKILNIVLKIVPTRCPMASKPFPVYVLKKGRQFIQKKNPMLNRYYTHKATRICI